MSWSRASNGAQIGKGRLYTPIPEDVGSVLKVEVVVIDSSFGVPREAGYTFSVSTTRVKVRTHLAAEQFSEPHQTPCCSHT